MKFKDEKTIEQHMRDLAAADYAAAEYQAKLRAAEQKRLAGTPAGKIADGLRSLPVDPQKEDAASTLAGIEKYFAERAAMREAMKQS